MAEERVQIRRKRSPSYPYINLEQAIKLTEVLYKKEGYSFTPVSVALEYMNYSPTSSSGVRVLATLLQFGLLDETGTRDNKEVRLSDVSMTIMEAPDDLTRLSAIQEAALNPDIHRELWQHWNLEKQPLPPVSRMRFSLLKEFGFHKNAVDGFIEEFRTTYEFAQLDERLIGTAAEMIADDKADEEAQHAKSAAARVHHVPHGMKEHTIQLIGQPMASLILPHPISQRNLEHLIRWLELMGPALTVPENDYDASGEQSDEGLPF